MSKKTLAYVVYPGISLLELVANRTLLGGMMARGPLLKLQAGYEVVVVGERIEKIATDTPMAIIPQKTFADVPQPDALVVIGGGADTLPALENAHLIEYVRHAGQHAAWVAATSTGALLLGAAGLLEGRLSATHWAYTDRLEAYGARPQPYRPAGWVTDGKFTTSAGVSGAVDMAIGLGAKLTTRDIGQFGQLMIEYDPHPPFGRLDWSTFDQKQPALAPLLSQHQAAEAPAHTIAFVLYPGLTVFDLAGPLEVLSALSRIAPQFRPVVVAEQAGPVMTDIGVRMVPNAAFADLPHPDAFFVPGGVTPTFKAMSNPAIRRYIRSAAQSAQWIVSVCTGALLLAAVGLLEGLEVTTHWLCPRYLEDLGAHYVQKRWTVNGNIINSAEVSAGIDMALYVVSRFTDEETARRVQWLIQYDPQPPFGGIDYQHLKRFPRLLRGISSLTAPLYTRKPRQLTRQEGKATTAYEGKDVNFEIKQVCPRDACMTSPPRQRSSFLLKENGRIASRLPRVTEPTERPAPMQQWQLDFKDASSVPPDAHGKKQHVGEILTILDKGSSILVAHHVRSDFSAETRLSAVAQTQAPHGLPTSLTLDRDTRWVGAPQGSDFPAALVRFCHALGVAVLLCDPHHPQQNGFVERSHRTLNQECLKPERPKTIDEVRQVTEACASHSHWQRPHQGISCGNRPPRVAFPTLPALPKIPGLVNPDAWLSQVKGQHLVRRVNRQGVVKVDVYPYSISSKLAGQKVTFSIQAQEQSLQVVSPQEDRRSLPLKGLHQRALPYQEYLARMQREASTQQRLLSLGRWKIRSD